jgi:protein-S-isoprenylcysteine O-methyltransferase Ste14
MPLSPVDQADRNSRNRGKLMAIAAAVLLALALFSALDPIGTTNFVRGVVWAVLTLLWLILLATGGGVLLNRQVRAMMNDEVSQLNRRRAIEAGFWSAMAMAIGLYFASYSWPVPVRAGLGMLTEVAIAAALIRYAWLELR